MKRVIFSFVAVYLSIAAAFAGENAVKQCVIRCYELCRDGNFSEMLALYTNDFSSTNAKTRKITRKDIETMILMLDGKHAEEFLLFIFKARTGKDLTPEEEKQMRALAGTEQIKLIYPYSCKMIKSAMSKTSGISLKSLKFSSVKINGNEAVAVYEYDELDPSDVSFTKTINRTSISRFRKENGVWKFSGSIQR